MSCEYGHDCELVDDDCPQCAIDEAASLREYLRRGGYHPNLKPLQPGEHTPGMSRDRLIREYDPG